MLRNYTYIGHVSLLVVQVGIILARPEGNDGIAELETLRKDDSDHLVRRRIAGEFAAVDEGGDAEEYSSARVELAAVDEHGDAELGGLFCGNGVFLAIECYYCLCI